MKTKINREFKVKSIGHWKLEKVKDNKFPAIKKSIKKLTIYIQIIALIFSLNMFTQKVSASQITKMNEWTSSPGTGFTLLANNIYKVMNDMSIGSSSTASSGLYVASGTTSVLYIPKNVTLTVHGGNGNADRGGYAAINLPATSTLIITGGGKLNVYGGSSGVSTAGSNGVKGIIERIGPGVAGMSGEGGAGGTGAGGAGAGIGGNGGNGGYRGRGAEPEMHTLMSETFYERGEKGYVGESGTAGISMGTLYAIGDVTIGGSGGVAASSGSEGTKGERAELRTANHDSVVNGGLGGNGGAATTAAGIIGGGTGGAGGGGGGGSGAIRSGLGIGWDDPGHGSSGSNGSNGTTGSRGYFYASRDFVVNRIPDMIMTTHSDIEYTLTLNSGAGTIDPGTETKTVTLGVVPDEIKIPQKKDITFLGYFSQSYGLGVKYLDESGKMSSEWDVPKDTMLYAKWNKNAATFDGNGGITSTPSVIIDTVGSALGTLPTANRTGYTFDNWHTDKSGGTMITSFSLMPADDVTYYAHWIINKYTVYFDVNDGTIIGNTSITKDYDSKLGTLPTATRVGYQFLGWFTEKEGGIEITSESKIPAENVTYHAQWIKNDYEVVNNPIYMSIDEARYLLKLDKMKSEGCAIQKMDKLSKASQKQYEKLVQLSNIKITEKRSGDNMEVKRAEHNINAIKNLYLTTFFLEDNTGFNIPVTVWDNGKEDEINKEKIFANDFAIASKDVEFLTEEKVIALANANAINIDTFSPVAITAEYSQIESKV